MRDAADAARPRTLYLHVGLPKTASTWLQDEVFSRLGRLRVVSKPRTRLFRMPADAAAGPAVFEGAMRRSATLWDSYGDALFAEMLGPLEAWRAEGRDLLVTDETIGRAGSRPALLAAHVAGIAATAARWGLGRVRVLCVIRRQDHWLASHYAQISDRLPRAGQAGFEAMVAEVLDPARARHGFGALLDFHLLRDALAGAVGPEALLILPLEALRDAPEATLGRILDWLDAPEDTARRVLAAALDRPANVRAQDAAWRLRAPTLRVPGLGRRLPRPARRRGTITLPSEVTAAILAAYGSGNRRLAATERLPLATWGYFGASSA